MKETKQVQGQAVTVVAREESHQAPERKATGIRLLEDYELVLAGGGDYQNDWP